MPALANLSTGNRGQGAGVLSPKSPGWRFAPEVAMPRAWRSPGRCPRGPMLFSVEKDRANRNRRSSGMPCEAEKRSSAPMGSRPDPSA